MNVRNIFLGKPVKSDDGHVFLKQRFSAFSGIARFASNSVSTVAYASEQIFITLAIMGIYMWGYSLWVSLLISLGIAFICGFYIYIIKIYPKNTNCFEIAGDNIKSPFFALLSSGAMLFDFVMTLAVSVSAAAAAIYSLKPILYTHAALVAVCIILILTYLNLRGNRLRNFLVYIPAYVFIGGVFAVIISVISYNISGAEISVSSEALFADVKRLYGHMHRDFTHFEYLSIFLFLKAFSNGFVALTSMETISEEVNDFKEPSALNAIKALVFTSGLLILMFLGISWAGSYLHIVPKPNETLISQIFSHVFSKGYLWHIFQISTVLVLFLAANASFAGFPRLIANIAKQSYAPRQFKNPGSKLAYSNGVWILTVLSIIITILFKASLFALIPLYAIGVFITFSITLFSVGIHLRKAGKVMGAVCLQLGSIVTAIMASVIVVSKFQHGSFFSLSIIFLMVFVFYKIHNHYTELDKELRLSPEDYAEPVPAKTTAIILTSGIHKGTISAISYSKSISKDARALYIDTDPDEAAFLRENWDIYSMGVPLVILNSPYRNIVRPVLQYLEEAKRERPGYIINVVIPEVLFRKSWHKLLHNKLAFVLRVILSFQKNVIVTHVSYDIKDENSVKNG